MSKLPQAWKLLVEVEQWIAQSPGSNPDHFDALLEKIGLFFDVDRVRLTLLDKDLSRLLSIQQWCAAGHSPSSLSELHIDAATALSQASFEEPGCRILHASPLIQAGKLLGFLFFETYDPAFEWTHAHSALVEQVLRLVVNRLPLKRIAQSTPDLSLTAPRAESRPNNEIHILIVEDDESNLFLIQKFVARFGGVAHVAKTGQEAIEACNQRQFDVILMDLSMPKLDGFDATREIVTGTSANCNTPIVAVTADTTEGIERRCKKIGMKHYLSKPLRMDAMIDILTKLTRHKFEPENAEDAKN